MTREEIKTLYESVPKGYKERSTIDLTDKTTGLTDSFNVPSSAVRRKLSFMLGWSEKKLEKVHVKVW